jgi:hypothetical protein
MNRKDWPAVMQAAQSFTHCRIDGVRYERVRYGDESEHGRDTLDDGRDTLDDCRDCGVAKDNFHVEFCCVEECPKCKRQVLSCAPLNRHGERELVQDLPTQTEANGDAKTYGDANTTLTKARREWLPPT